MVAQKKTRKLKRVDKSKKAPAKRVLRRVERKRPANGAKRPVAATLGDLTSNQFDPKDLTPEMLAYSLPGAWANYCTGGLWKYAPHLQLLEDKLLQVESGEIKRLLVSLPPGHGKSMFISQFFSSWFLGRNPTKKIILAGYESMFAASWGRKSRDALDEYGEKVFGNTVNPNIASVSDWAVKGFLGGMVTAGAQGPLTGKHADLAIIDDPVKNDKDALSSGVMDGIWEWYKATFYSRIKTNGAIILIMTRWASDDLVGRLLDQEEQGGDKWDKLILPAVAVEDDPLGREVGEALWPDPNIGFPIDRLNQIRKVQEGDYWWSTLYQCNPGKITGGIVDITWFQRYTAPPPRDDVSHIVLSFDTANKAKDVNDFTVCGVWYVYDNNFYLIKVIRRKMKHPQLVELAMEMIDVWLPHAVIIEDKGSGTSLIQHLEDNSSTPIVPMVPTQDKVIRMQNETLPIEAGRVFLPVAADWLDDFESEVRAFPNSIRKDQVDMLSQTLKYFRERPSYGIDVF